MVPSLVKVSSKNQITLPRAVTQRLGDARYLQVSMRGRDVVLRPACVTVPGQALAAVRAKIRRLGLSEDIIPRAIAAVRAAGK